MPTFVWGIDLSSQAPGFEILKLSGYKNFFLQCKLNYGTVAHRIYCINAFWDCAVKNLKRLMHIIIQVLLTKFMLYGIAPTSLLRYIALSMNVGPCM